MVRRNSLKFEFRAIFLPFKFPDSIKLGSQNNIKHKHSSLMFYTGGYLEIIFFILNLTNSMSLDPKVCTCCIIHANDDNGVFILYIHNEHYIMMINGVNHDKIPKLNYSFWVECRVASRRTRNYANFQWRRDHDLTVM